MGSFTEQALQTQADLRDHELVQIISIPEVIHATARGDVDLGFVAIENAIEGSVNATLDTLAFDTDLLIEREVVMAVHLSLIVRPGVELADMTHMRGFDHDIAEDESWRPHAAHHRDHYPEGA